MNIGLFLVVFVSLIQSYTSTGDVKKIFFNNKEIVRHFLQGFDISLKFKKIKRANQKKGFFLIFIFVTLNSIVIFLNLQSGEHYIQLILGLIPVSFLLMTILKFLFYVSMTNYELKVLIGTFDGIVKIDANKMIENLHMVEMKTKPIKLHNDPLNKIRAACNIYCCIYDNSGLINDSMGWTVLCSVISLTTALTVEGYGLFVIAVGGNSLKELPGEFFIKN